MSLSLEYRTILCVDNECARPYIHCAKTLFEYQANDAALSLLSGAIQHHMAFFVDSLSQDEKRAWLLTFYTLAEAEQAVRA